MTYLDQDDPRPDGSFPEKTGRIILSGGEVLIDPVRERVTYKVIERLAAKYAEQGGVKVVVQTTGDRVVDVQGDPDNPVSRGYTCSKGRASGDLHHHPARLDANREREVG